MSDAKTYLFTGLPCSGKTTLVKEIMKKIGDNSSEKFVHYDGDTFRKIYTPELGFTKDDRIKNLRILAEKAKQANYSGKIIFASFVSPTEESREIIKQIVGNENFFLVYVKCPLEICEKRDVKGMYAEARKGKRENFTGIGSPFEEPIKPNLIIKTNQKSPKESAEEFLLKTNLISFVKIKSSI